jgi:hypothetical protein
LFIYSLIQISFNSFLCLQAAVEALCLAEKMGLTNTSEGKKKRKKEIGEIVEGRRGGGEQEREGEGREGEEGIEKDRGRERKRKREEKKGLGG